MDHSDFVKRETVKLANSAGRMSAWGLNYRLLSSLPLFLKLLPLSLLLILVSSLAPSLFRWYVGTFADGPGQAHLPYLSWRVPIGIVGVVLIAILATFLRIAAWVSFEISGMWSAQEIHAQMTAALLRTRTTFFDENPSGRLINRLVRDYDEVRSTAIIFIGDILNAGTELLSVSVLTLLVSKWAALAIIPLLVVFICIQWYRTGMIDHARSLAAISTGKVLDRKTDLIEGREIFLLYGKAQRLLDRMEHGFRQYVRASILGSQIETWASFWVNIAAEVFSLVALVALVFGLRNGHLDLITAGVIISALFGVRGSIGWLDFASSLIGRSVPHVRRVFEFADLPPEEVEECSPTTRLPKNPMSTMSTSGGNLNASYSSKSFVAGHSETSVAETSVAEVPVGDIQFVNYTMSYHKETPVVLRDLNLFLPLGSKTALTGRTGSGKTSVIQALFRMVYVHSGDLRIGNQSALGIQIQALRALFGMVPQFPYLFGGTLRSNLDRSKKLSDDKLIAALDAVGLPKLQLGGPVAEGGMNFSLGERQLLCLARVIAANRPYVIMDEPTSGLDPKTDAKVQQVLASHLSGKTVLTIAHRTESLSLYDQVIEMKCVVPSTSD